MTLPLAASTPALWYLTRGSGAVALLLLTASLVLGILQVERFSAGGRLPRFVTGSLHRSISLLVVVFVAIHVLTAVLDTFAPIRLLDAVVPFTGVYRPLWLGFGALAFDALLALVITSLVRRRLGLRAWRAVHWLAYAAWPVAVLHGVGTGSDAKTAWLQIITAGCVALVVAAVVARVRPASGVLPGRRTAALGTLAAVLLGSGIWAAQGPLASGWAGRAGTPAKLLARPVAAISAPTAPLASGFSGAVRGTRRQAVGSDGTGVIELRLRSRPATIRVRLGGTVDPGGGLRLARSAVYLGPPGDPARYRGRVTQLDGSRLRASVGAPDGQALRLTLDLHLDGDRVSGAAHGTPTRSVTG